AVVTALILVMSVFNGFESLITDMLSNFNPDVKITALKGKTFHIDSTMIKKLESIPNVIAVSVTLEEKALFESNQVQDFGTLKGVDNKFRMVTHLDSSIKEGKYLLRSGDLDMAVVGAGLGNRLAVQPERSTAPLAVYTPHTGTSGTVDKPFTRMFLYPSGTFSIQQEVDYEYVIASLDFVQDFLNKKEEASSIEIRLNNYQFSQKETIRKIKDITGNTFVVKNRYQQEESFLKLMNIEKWISFAILSLTLLLVAFNMTGALWMMVIEKKPDIAILKSIGMNDSSVKNIFMLLGLVLSGFGFLLGLIIAVILYTLQKEIGLVSVPEGFAVSSYPINMEMLDIIAILFVVMTIGWLAAYMPARRAKLGDTIYRVE
ncbi:MAG TPA: FtsX-like permease family protein, partial [Saprospiraceae bacterium]|nr:FtsX-like permease family protein [Saprospiraceae bacterium]